MAYKELYNLLSNAEKMAQELSKQIKNSDKKYELG